MKRLAVVLVCAFLQLCVHAQTPAARPRITGIDHVAFYTTAPDGVKKLYGDVLGLASAEPVEPGCTLRYMVGTQWVGYSAAPDAKSTDRMDHVALATDNITSLRKYLGAQGIKVPEIRARADHSLFFMIDDPDGHKIEFVERDTRKEPPSAPSAVSHHMIHAGFLVYRREAADHFYRDILGFRPYWHGGMKPDVTEWLAIQVPDGTDWIEYMLNQPNPDAHLSGVMNHISLGVKDMNAAQMKIESHGWKPSAEEHSQIGRDGKLQLNLFDPDLSRIELMEFTPVDKPCCSEFTGPHPSEDH
jgi:catechol 2,3-dioxygenase-like lactoylglutathione lyase family enzyme